jgi:HK97 gp10 family phage protein
MNVKFEGIDNIILKFNKVADAENTEKAMQKACLLVEAEAKKKAHKIRRTGTLANSITSKVEKDSEGIKGIVFTPLEYAPYVEYGTGLFAEEGNGRKTPWAYEDEETGETIWTRGQKPQPYLRPALYENREKINSILKEGVKID